MNEQEYQNTIEIFNNFALIGPATLEQFKLLGYCDEPTPADIIRLWVEINLVTLAHDTQVVLEQDRATLQQYVVPTLIDKWLEVTKLVLALKI